MFAVSSKFVPAANVLRRVVQPASFRRNFWGYPAVSGIVRDVERQMDRLERDFFRFSPLRRLMPRYIPIEGTDAASNDFRISIDVSGYKPEEVALSLKDKVLCIEAKMERSSEDGSKFFQIVKREFQLPDNVEADSLKSFITNDGILTIEAPSQQEKPKELPISKQ